MGPAAVSTGVMKVGARLALNVVLGVVYACVWQDRAMRMGRALYLSEVGGQQDWRRQHGCY